MVDITRRSLIAGAGGSLALPALARAAVPDAPPAPARRPNIVFILADDLGYADLSCYGRPDFKTPNVDRLAAGGMRFLQAYANSAVCSATRTALITGRYQDRLAIGLEEPLAANVAGLPPSHPTLPSLLRAAGYRTALVGKWHLGFLPDYGPLKSGYEHYFGIRGGAADYYDHDKTLWNEDVPAHEAG
ncbi:MAG: sulfatase-like hydrolase/transferase, partial [Caulobacteraceae bacterium]|nr:sulfatase-like hydrolase/transferase [Caulobacter sp.]